MPIAHAQCPCHICLCKCPASWMLLGAGIAVFHNPCPPSPFSLLPLPCSHLNPASVLALHMIIYVAGVPHGTLTVSSQATFLQVID